MSDIRKTDDGVRLPQFPLHDKFFLHMAFEICTMIFGVCTALGGSLALTVFLVRKAMGY